MKKRFYALLAFCVMVCGFVTLGVDVNADITGQAEVVCAEPLDTSQLMESDVLQEGGMLPESVKKYGSSSNYSQYAGAEKAIANAMMKVQSSVDLTAYAIPSDIIYDLCGNVLNTTPELFYVKEYGAWYNQSTNLITKLNIYYETDINTIQIMKAEYEYEVKMLLSQIKSDWSDFEKVLFVNDYLATNCEYNHAVYDDQTLDVYDVYAVFVKKKAVCQGYALAFMDIMDRLGIPCELVSSGSLWHAWNIVKVGGYWYQIDVTWNDPSSGVNGNNNISNDKLGQAAHTNLLKSTAYFQDPNRGGHIKDNSSGSFIYDYVYTNSYTDSVAYNTRYDAYFWDDVYSAFAYYNGIWYGLVGDTNYNPKGIYKFVYSNGNLVNQGVLKNLSYQWTGSDRRYMGYCSVYQGLLYYSTPSSIRYINLSNGHDAQYLSVSGNNIYGMRIDMYGDLTYGTAVNASVATTNTTQTLTHTHNTYGSASCTAPVTCTTCKKMMGKPKGHYVGPAATCISAQVCTRGCGAVFAPALGHQPGPAATCTRSQTCTRPGCGAVLAAAKGHVPNTSAPTCSAGQYCTTCGTTMARATGHIHTYQKIEPATFKKAKRINTYCSSCNLLMSTRTSGKKLTCKKGSVYTVGNYKYKIISNKTNGKGTVAFHGLAKNVSNVVIGSTVTIKGAKFKITEISAKALRKKTKVTAVTIGKNVTTIGKEAFFGAKKLKTITVKSTKLKSVGKNALKSIYKKAKIKVPKSRLSKYKKMFKGKGQKSSVKITK